MIKSHTLALSSGSGSDHILQPLRTDAFFASLGREGKQEIGPHSCYWGSASFADTETTFTVNQANTRER